MIKERNLHRDVIDKLGPFGIGNQAGAKYYVDRNNTTIIEGKGKKSEIQKRVKALKALLNDKMSNYQAEDHRARLGKLTGKVAVIKVGAPTEAEILDKKLKLEDALNATRSAIEEGILPGGGKALFLAANELHHLWSTIEDDDIAIGVYIVMRAITETIKQLL